MMNEFRKTGMDACCTLVCSLFQPTIHLDEREGVRSWNKVAGASEVCGCAREGRCSHRLVAGHTPSVLRDDVRGFADGWVPL